MKRLVQSGRQFSSKSIKIVEVGPRDGLQNEKKLVPTEIKLELIDRLVNSGLKNIEATAFVSPKWVPQMSDQKEVMQQTSQKYLDSNKNLQFSALTPNLKGYDTAITHGCQEVAVFGAASEAFSKKNINCSIEESLVRFNPVVEKAKLDNIPVRGYVSCIAGCPYQGQVPVSDVVKVSEKLFEMGCHEISLGDTIGVGTPKRIKSVLKSLLEAGLPVDRLALHCHDTYGQAIANCYTGLEMGVTVFDSAVSGLGGCPYAKGASGNVSTEDLVYMLEGCGMETGVNLDILSETGNWISEFLERCPGSKVANATRK